MQAGDQRIPRAVNQRLGLRWQHSRLLQHEQVRDLLEAVRRTSDEVARRAEFNRLRELLSRHEAAEEMVLRPVVRRLSGGKDEAERRMAEENEAKALLAELDDAGLMSDEFDRGLARFRDLVLAHADAEEREELALLDKLPPKSRSQLAVAFRNSERAAPTHPHPKARSTAANYLLGPFAAVVDRLRDLRRPG